MDRIAAAFPNDRNMQFARAGAWRYVASATRAEPAECHRHAETVERITAPFPNDRIMQEQRNLAWSYVVR